MAEEQLSHQESLDIISDMIARAKRSYSRGGSFYFLLWGWVCMLANLGHYVLDKFIGFEHPYLVWALTIPAAFVSIFYGKRQEERAGTVTHLNRLYGHVWLAVGVAVIVLIMFMPAVNYNHNAIIMLLAGVGTYISGTMLRFRPLILGGILLWIAGIVAFNVSVVDQYLVGTFGILLGYLVPGYLMKRTGR